MRDDEVHKGDQDDRDHLTLYNGAFHTVGSTTQRERDREREKERRRDGEERERDKHTTVLMPAI